MANKAVDLSIIVPIYNDERTICRCIESIDVPSNYHVEIIVINDNSSDDSLKKVRDVAKTNSHVKVFSLKSNSGPNIARGYGVKKASGKYILFLDADDELAPQACATLLNEAYQEPVDILHFSMNVIPSNGTSAHQAKGIEKWLKPPKKSLAQSELIDLCYDERSLSWNLCGKLFSSKTCKLAFSQISKQRYLRAEDLYAFLIIALNSEEYRGCPEHNLYIYNYGLGGDGGENISLDDYINNWLSLPTLYNDIVDYFNHHKIASRYPHLLMNIKDILIDDCVDFMVYRVPTRSKRTAYHRLVSAWRDVDIDEYIVRRLDSQKKRLLFRGLKASLFFKKHVGAEK